MTTSGRTPRCEDGLNVIDERWIRDEDVGHSSSWINRNIKVGASQEHRGRNQRTR
jgi:hypothetical protein